MCHHQSLQLKVWQQWRALAKKEVKMEEEADHARYYFHARRALTRWYSIFKTKHKKRIHDTLVRYASQMNHVRLARSFGHWRRKVRHCLDLQRTANKVWREIQVESLHSILCDWRSRLLLIKEAERKSDAENNFGLKRL
jgi:Sfi1 spindle body protein